jgi:hypothetical protein
MSDAPERIIVVQGDYGDLASASVHTPDEGYTEEHGTEYVRADLVPAQPSQAQPGCWCFDTYNHDAGCPEAQQAGVTEAMVDALRHALGGFESIRRCAAETGADAFITTCALRHIELLTAALSARQGEGE